MLPYYDRDQIAAVLNIDTLINAMEKALIAFSTGASLQPVRMRVIDAEAGGDMCLMPAVTDVFAVKLVGNYPGNHDRGLPSHNAVVVVFDRWTGLPRAVLDGTYITQMRTSAVSAMAARRLAAPDAKVLTIIGNGIQAHGHFETMRRVRAFDEVRVWARDVAKAQAFAAEIGATAYASAEDAVRGADVIATTTSAREPVVKGEWLKPGAHLSAVGWNGLDGRELDDAVMKNLVLVESRDAASQESGNILLSGATIHAELGEVLAGTAQVDITKTTVFISVGIATEDAFAASLALSALGG
ncbi:ornithine cyclodeaminase family protein [Ancylobacter rudongensis]|uniref:Thiomorpholine-carboxylate dehydrogenase n=1 Tax=Ancylobacter rudongensis TaxID=177413 RepID=A0A1G4SCU7_9HYPH|nr:ornithine cyclodeaminase family protein [Ancylobacter rudongensis]SCW67013.1 thiomorpholine-carboxylate dehydrogenase [Ancylobacter rudongensis]